MQKSFQKRIFMSFDAELSFAQIAGLKAIFINSFEIHNCFRYVPPLDPAKKPMEIAIGFDNFEILKIDDRDFTVEINAYLIVKWKDPRVIIDFYQVSIALLFTG